jgi:hypothetical protein
MRAFGSPKIPRTVDLGRKPGKQYVSHKRRCFRIPKSCQISQPLKYSNLPRTQPTFYAIFTHSIGRRPKTFLAVAQLPSPPDTDDQKATAQTKQLTRI